MTREALEAGAFGFTTSRTNSHKTPTGEMVPGRYSEVQELLGIGSALKGLKHGAFGVNSDFEVEAEELAWMTKLGQDTGRPVWFLLTDRPTDPVRWQRLMEGVRTARAQGASVTAQIAGRPVGVMLGVDTALNPFSIRPSYQALLKLPAAERLARLQDPAVRAQILNDEPSAELVRRLSQFRQQITTRWDRMFVMGDPPDYEPEASSSIAAIAQRSNHSPAEVAYDYLAGGPDRFLFFPIVGYNEDNHDIIRTMLTSPETVLGLSDGGAHCSSIIDASLPSWMLTHWGRDRKRGPGLPLELIVKRQTSETADFFGFADRGRLAPGLKADVNVIDFERLRLHVPEIRYDLPAGGRRLVQRVDGYIATFVSGVPVFEHGNYTGATPGRLVRADDPLARPSSTSWERENFGSPSPNGRRVRERGHDSLARNVLWHAAQASPTTFICASTPSVSPALASSANFSACFEVVGVHLESAGSDQTAGNALVLCPCRCRGGIATETAFQRAIAFAGFSSVFTSPLATTRRFRRNRRSADPVRPGESQSDRTPRPAQYPRPPAPKPRKAQASSSS